MAPEQPIPTEFDIPQELLDLIDQMEKVDLELERQAEPDFEPGEALMATDHRINMARFLYWFKRNMRTGLTLFPSGGYDTLPRAVLGAENVLYTQVRGPLARGESFLGDIGGEQYTVDHSHLPFNDEYFQTVLLHRFSDEVSTPELREFERVIKRDGTAIIVKMWGELTGDSALKAERFMIQYFQDSPNFSPVEIPDPLQGQGETGSEFYLFQKKPSI